MYTMENDINLLTQHIVIRKAYRYDLPALEWKGEFRKYRTLYHGVYESSLRGEAIMWIAEHNIRGVIGQLFVQLVSTRKDLADGYERAYLYGFRIQSRYRGKGIGSHMLKIAESDLRKRGYRLICLNVSRDNEGARNLYERNGYVVVAADPGIWSYVDDLGKFREVYEPGWRMEKEISL
jgi:ribosomal protein S18 acetylase RimI-like enzyme